MDQRCEDSCTIYVGMKQQTKNICEQIKGLRVQTIYKVYYKAVCLKYKL